MEEKRILKYAVGMDVSHGDIKCNICSIDSTQRVKVVRSRKFANGLSGFRELEAWSSKYAIGSKIETVYLMEATGVYYEGAAHFLYEKGLRVSVIVPNRAKRFAQSLGLRSKTDAIDAYGLAQMAVQMTLEPWKPFSDQHNELIKLTRYHTSLQEAKTMVSNQLHAQNHSGRPSKFVASKLEVRVALLEKDLKACKAEIKKLISKDKELERKVKMISDSIHGVGFMTVITIVCETNGFLNFSNSRQLTSFSGYDVIENQSGKRNGKTRISKAGNKYIRRALYFPALNATKIDGPLKKFYDRIFHRHFIFKKANVAVQRKLLCLIYTLWTNDQPYDMEYHETQMPISQESSFQANEKLKVKKAAKSVKKSSPQGATLDESQLAEAPGILFSVPET